MFGTSLHEKIEEYLQANENVVHFVCEHDENIALCGKDVSDHEWAYIVSRKEKVCKKCEELNLMYDMMEVACEHEMAGSGDG